MEPFLQFDNISKSFPGVKALSDISFSLEEGTVHGLIGENGAGKSTLIKILSGFYQPDAGVIKIKGASQIFSSPFDAVRAGISVIHQELQLIPNQTVAENINLGDYGAKSGIVSWDNLFSNVRKFLDKVGIEIDERTKISKLTLGQQQMVEIAKAIKKNSAIIAFDEPTSSLSKPETDLLFAIIRKLRSEGKVLIYISHRMAEIFELSDACTVLKDGFYVATHKASSEGMSRGNLIQEMTGKNLQNIYNYNPRNLGDRALEIKGVQGPGVSAPASFYIRKGEIVGFFGLIGAGRSELARLVYGSIPRNSGEVRVQKKLILQKCVKDSIKDGVMFCTEDRKKEGIINGRTIWENINISCRRHFSFLDTFLNLKKEKRNADSQVFSLNIKTPSINQDIVNLSGGNQQKVILGRWLSESGMKVLIIDEPTRGIDIGAKNEIYNILYSLAESGIAIMVISGELPEITGICDRIYVMREGEISKEIERKNFTESAILEHAFPKERKHSQLKQ